MEMPFSPRDTACSGTYVTVTKCLYSTVEAMIMSIATKNNVSIGYFSCSESCIHPDSWYMTLEHSSYICDALAWHMRWHVLPLFGIISTESFSKIFEIIRPILFIPYFPNVCSFFSLFFHACKTIGACTN
jgi:hypothetical protein